MEEKEKISQLMDGELDEAGAASALAALRDDIVAGETWRTYHLISDAIRDTPLLSQGFAARLSERLAAERTVLAPARGLARPRLWLAAAASSAAVALVAWLAFAPQPEPRASIAKAAPPVVAVMALPKAANDYLLAHQSSSPRIYLQGMAPYVRTVSEPADGSDK